MISAETFLEQLADRRRQAQADALRSLSIPQDVVLPQELRIAVNFGGAVSPVLARSVYAPSEAYIGIPSSDPALLLHWFATYPDCNWALSTGVEAGIIAAEFDYGLTQQSLVDVNDWEDDWHNTLRFETAQACFALFAISAQRISPKIQPLHGTYGALRRPRLHTAVVGVGQEAGIF